MKRVRKPAVHKQLREGVAMCWQDDARLATAEFVDDWNHVTCKFCLRRQANEGIATEEGHILMPISNSDQMTKVDPEDYPELSKRSWNLNWFGYVRGSKRVDGKITSLMMHRVVIGAEKGQEVDHINGDKLDNRKANLRICTRAENCRNTPRRRDNTTGYKGVVKVRNRYWAQIQMQTIGWYDTAEDAARAYDKKARELSGEFAWVNFPDEQ